MKQTENTFQLLRCIHLNKLSILLLVLLIFCCTNQSKKEERLPESDPRILTAGRHFFQKAGNYAHFWVADLKWTLSDKQVLREFISEWVVPEAPTEQGNQTIFYFPALHDVAILQPVLQWGKSAIGGGEYWSVASWYVLTPFGPYKSTPPVEVKPGDRCKSKMLYKGYNGKTYQYESHIEVNGIAQKPLLVSSKYYLKNVYLTLEDYRVDNCKKHSASGEFKFENVVLKGENIPEKIPWIKHINPDIICHEDITIVSPTASEKSPGLVTIKFDDKGVQ